MKHYTKLIALTLAGILLLACAACGPDRPIEHATEPITAAPGIANGPVDWTGFPFPQPDGAQCESIGGTIYCRGIDVEGFKAYRKVLAKQGWQVVYQGGGGFPPDEDPHWAYLKGNDYLYIVNQSHENSGEEIRLVYTPGYSGGKRKGALTNEQALPLVQQIIENYPCDWPDFSDADVKHLAEQALPGVWEATGMQLFFAFGDEPLCSFLLSGTDSKGMCLPFNDFKDYCVADIDQDGTPELIRLYGWGSGIYRVCCEAFKVEAGQVTIVYMSTWYPKGYSTLQLRCVSNTEVRLIGMEGEDYGPLRIEGDKFVVDAEDFPFSERMGGW